MQYLSVLVLVGAIQGFITSALLAKSKSGVSVSKRLLAGLILVFSMACFNLYLMQSGFRYKSDLTRGLADILPLLLPMAVGPLLYFYTRSVLDPDMRIRRLLPHLAALSVDLVPYAAGIVLVTGMHTNMLPWIHEGRLRYLVDQYNVYADLIRWASVTIYLYLSWRHLYHRGSAEDRRGWIRELLVAVSAFQVTWLLHLVPYIIPASRDQLIGLVDWYPVYIPLTILVYWLGIKGYLNHGEIRRGRTQKSSDAGLSIEVIVRTEQALIRAMEKERLYLDPELNLQLISKHTGVPQKTISAVLNQHMGKTFNEFVNGYRVTELKKRLISEESGHLTIMGIALECGFNSQATMQRSFKLLTRQSPKEFQLAHQKKMAKTIVKSGIE